MSKQTQCALTTFDNPYDPFREFTKWFMFDVDHGYYSSSYLARIANTSDQLTDEENMQEIERAIDEIIKYDFRGIYKKIRMNASENDQKDEPKDTDSTQEDA